MSITITPPLFRYWLPWVLGAGAWGVLLGALHMWTGRMIVDPSDRTALGLVVVCLSVLLACPFVIMLGRVAVSTPWLRRSLARGALLAFFLGATAPAYFLAQSPRWQLYVLVSKAHAKVDNARRQAGHVIPLQTELEQLTRDPDQAQRARARLGDIVAASSDEATLSAFAQALHAGRGPTVGASDVLANGLARPQQIRLLIDLGHALEASKSENDLALARLIAQVPRKSLRDQR